MLELHNLWGIIYKIWRKAVCKNISIRILRGNSVVPFPESQSHFILKYLHNCKGWWWGTCGFLNSVLESCLTTFMQGCSKLHLTENIAQKKNQFYGTDFASKAVKVFVVHHLDIWGNVVTDIQMLFKSCSWFLQPIRQSHSRT